MSANEAGWYEGHVGKGFFGPHLPERHCPLTAVCCTKCGLVELFAG
jgi:hypothetical protein